MTEITTDSITEAHSLAKEIAKTYKVLVTINRQSDLFVITTNPNVNLKTIVDSFKKIDKGVDASVQQVNTLKTEVNQLSDKYLSIKNQYADSEKKYRNEINSLFDQGLIELCKQCIGEGFLKNKCAECEGEGIKKKEIMNFNLCDACGGDGGISGNCYKCGGTGYKVDTSYISCEKCIGQGYEKCSYCAQQGFLGEVNLINFVKKMSLILSVDLKFFE